MEQKHEGVNFTRVDSDLSELMKEIDEHHDEEVHNKLVDSVKNLFLSALNKETLDIKLESLKSKDVSAMIILSESSRRMQDMAKNV